MPRLPDVLKIKLGIPSTFEVEGEWALTPRTRKLHDMPSSATGFLIVNKQHDECLDVAWDRTTATIYRCRVHRSLNQQWYLYLREDGNLVIASRLTGKVIGTRGLGKQMGAAVEQFDHSGDPHQLWQLEQQVDRSYTIRSVQSGFCLDMPPNALDDGSAAVQWEPHEGDNQRWWLKPAI